MRSHKARGKNEVGLCTCHKVQFYFQVKDRTVIKTNDNETRVTEPIDLQNKIDELVKNWTNARSFVR